MQLQNITLRLSCPKEERLCFDGTIFPFVFYLEKFKREQEAILSGKQQNISPNFRLLMYLLARNHYLFETNHIYNELKNERNSEELNELISSIFEDMLEDISGNLDVYLKELIVEGYLDYIYVRESDSAPH